MKESLVRDLSNEVAKFIIDHNFTDLDSLAPQSKLGYNTLYSESVHLTLIQRAILHDLASGLNVKQIALKTDRAVNTTRWHIQRIIDKLTAKTTAHAVAKAVSLKLIKIDENLDSKLK